MNSDILVEMGHLFLGSRLKRLAERLQTDAAKIIRDAGFAFQPSQLTLLAAVERYGPLTVGQAVTALGLSQPSVTRNMTGLIALGLLETRRSSTDLRQKTIALTQEGAEVLARAKASIWPGVDAAVAAVCGELSGPLLQQLTTLEAELAHTPLDRRFAQIVATWSPTADLSIIEYSDALAGPFLAINKEWIDSMFVMEKTDRDVLENPRATIVDPGGAIMFVEAAGLGIVGTCALRSAGEGHFELTKMAVLERARGRKAGEFLLSATIERARRMGVQTLYLLTNAKCAAAIHLYEKLGFVHDAEIMGRYGGQYERCNVAMSFPF